VKRTRIALILFGGLLFTTLNTAEAWEYFYSQPRIMAGGEIGMFRISLDQFEDIYTSRWGESLGGFAGVRITRAYYFTCKYGQFSQNGKTGKHPESGANLSRSRWEEEWYQFGVRVHPPITRKFNSYYGFGISYFKTSEVDQLSVFTLNKTSENTGSGFYMELGFEYFPVQYLAAYLQMEVSSGGVKGNTGFESMSIGGFRFTAGVSVWPF